MSSAHSKQHKKRRPAFLLALAIIALSLYVIVQLIWGSRLYQSYTREEAKRIEAIFSQCVSNYAFEILSEGVHDPNNPQIIIERIPEEEGDSAMNKATNIVDINSTNEMQRLIENTFVLAEMLKDTLFLPKMSNHVSDVCKDEGVVSFTLSLYAPGDSLIRTQTTVISNDKKHLGTYYQHATREYKSRKAERTLVLDIHSKLPSSLILVLALFVIGVIVLIVIFYLLSRLSRDLTHEKAESDQQRQYFFGLVHDLKLPLALAHSMLDGMSHDLLSQDPEEVKGLVIEADEQIMKLTDNVQSLLLLRRAEQTQLFAPKSLYLYDIIEDIENELVAYYPKKSISIECDFADDTLLYLPEEELRLILRILMDNAIKYNDETPKIVISSHEESNQWHIAIRDNGVGIEQGTPHRAQIVSRTWLSKLNDSLNNGIGLMTAWILLSALGGHMTYRRANEKGSIFTVFIPKSK